LDELKILSGKCIGKKNIGNLGSTVLNGDDVENQALHVLCSFLLFQMTVRTKSFILFTSGLRLMLVGFQWVVCQHMPGHERESLRGSIRVFIWKVSVEGGTHLPKKKREREKEKKNMVT
jgi:hypothetical protein